MKKETRLTKAFGCNEAGVADLPRKISGTKIARFVHGEEAGCTFCFPHGHEVVNNRYRKRQRAWKSQRRTKWKTGRN
jgi:hypothetical protein